MQKQENPVPKMSGEGEAGYFIIDEVADIPEGYFDAVPGQKARRSPDRQRTAGGRTASLHPESKAVVLDLAGEALLSALPSKSTIRRQRFYRNIMRYGPNDALLGENPPLAQRRHALVVACDSIAYAYSRRRRS